MVDARRNFYENAKTNAKENNNDKLLKTGEYVGRSYSIILILKWFKVENYKYNLLVLSICLKPKI